MTALPPFNPDETKPAASDLVSAYPAAEQSFRDIIESWLLIEHNRDGQHDQVTLEDLTGLTPAGVASHVTMWQEGGLVKFRDGIGTVRDVLNTTTGDMTVANDLGVLGDFSVAGTATFGPVAAFADGTVGAPSITFITDPDTGFFSSALGAISVTLNGATEVTFAVAGTTVNALAVNEEVILGTATLTSSAAISFPLAGASRRYLTLDHDTIITVSGEVAEQTAEIWITQGTTGGTALWDGVDKWFGGQPPVLSTTAGEIDLIAITVLTGGVVVGQHIGVAA